MATDDDDAATLRERVRELEQTVAQQQDTIQQLLPSRRAILAGGAGLVGGAALTGQASAQSAAGQVGTSSEPVDVEAATVTADSVNTVDLSVDNLGASASISTNQTLASSNTAETVQFDTLEYDHRDEFDTGNHEFVVSEPGDYLVVSQVAALFNGSELRVTLRLNGRDEMRRRERMDGFIPSILLVKTLEGLSAGDTITVTATQFTGGSADLEGGGSGTFIEVIKVA